MIVCRADEIEISSFEQTKFAGFVLWTDKNPLDENIIFIIFVDENRFRLLGGRNLNFIHGVDDAEQTIVTYFEIY